MADDWDEYDAGKRIDYKIKIRVKEKDKWIDKWIDKQTTLSSPYNFINPPDAVYNTPWKTNPLNSRFGKSDGLPSHSVPFEEAISGTLEIDWTFETPFLIGRAKDRNDSESAAKKENKPVKYGDDYVIPGSSIRGMLRNVLEITTAARLVHIDREARFYFRDTTGGSAVQKLWLKALYPDGKVDDDKWLYGGYLIPPPGAATDKKWVKTDGWKLVPCKLARIDQTLACKAMGDRYNQFRELSANDRLSRLGSKLFQKVKCELALRKNKKIFETPWQEAVPVDWKSQLPNRKQQAAPASNATTGHITPVGPVEDGKNDSWMFHYNREPEANAIDVPEAVIQRFLQGHSSVTGGRGALDFWRGEVKSNPGTEIRVVFVCHDLPALRRGKTLGPQKFFISLSRMLKAPHLHTVGDVAQQSSAPFREDDKGLDFVQALFGHVPMAKGDQEIKVEAGKPQTQSWKGRVFFRHGELLPGSADVKTKLISGVTEKPRASFAPYYLRPKVGSNANEMLHWSREHIRLAGVKRYPLRTKPGKFPQLSATSTSDNSSNMKFVLPSQGYKKGESATPQLTFRAKIRLHNVHPIELGGLLWAIGLCRLDEKDTVWRHAMGRGKPQGFGRVRGTLVADTSALETGMGEAVDTGRLNQLTVEFEAWLKAQAGADNLGKIDHVAELRAMADPEIGGKIAGENMLEYPAVLKDGERDSIEGHKKIKAAAVWRNNKKPALHLWRYPRSKRGDK